MTQRDYYDDDYSQDGRARDARRGNTYPQDASSRNPYTRNAYVRDGYARDGYARDGYARETYQQDGYSGDAYSRGSYARDAYSQDAYTRDAYSQDAYSRSTYSRDSYSQAAAERQARRDARARAAQERVYQERQQQVDTAYNRRAQYAPTTSEYVDRGQGQDSARRGSGRASASFSDTGASAAGMLRENPRLIAAIVGLVLALALIAVGLASCAGCFGPSGQDQQAGGTIPVTQQSDGTATGQDTAGQSADGQVADGQAADGQTAGDQGTDAAAGTAVLTETQVPEPEPEPDLTITPATGLSMTASIAGVTPPEGYQGVEDPWVPSGRWSSGDPVLDGYVKEFCDGQVKEGLDFSDNAYNMYLSISWSNYVERDDNQNPQGQQWAYQNARSYWEMGGGNCFEFSAFLSFCMQYFGYADAHAEPLVILFQSGNWGDHCIVFVTNKDGSQCLLDTARGSNGWMVPANAYTYEVNNIGQNIVNSFEYGAQYAQQIAAQTAANTSTAA